MALFRILLVVMILVLVVYTAIVIQAHGWNLIPIFFGDMAAMTWPGQFNLDFFGFLMLSALWTAWRNGFSPSGLGLAVVALFGGIIFLAPYLLYLSFKESGDARGILLGVNRA